MNSERKRMKVITPSDNKNGDKTYWRQIGTAWVKPDGATTVFLDALPINGRLFICEFESKKEQPSEDSPINSTSFPNHQIPLNQTPDHNAIPF